MKIINYRGMTFEVEDRFKYIATDADGSVWVFEREPEYSYEHCDWIPVSGGDCKMLEYNFKHAEDSLENI